MKIKTNIRAGKGLGDAVADVTHVTRLDKLAQAYTSATGKDCGCDQRKLWLNNLGNVK